MKIIKKENVKYLIGLIALSLPTYLVRFNIGGIPTTVLEILIYIIFLYGLLNLGYSQMLRAKKRVWLVVGVLLIAALISVVISPLKSVALGQFKAYFVDPILVLYLIICYLEIKDLRQVLYGLGLSSLVVSGFNIIQKLLGHVTADNRVVGIFGYSPNYVALYLTPIIVLLVGYGLNLFYKKSAQGRSALGGNYRMAIMVGVVIMLNLVGLFLTGSRSGYLATVAGIIIYLILHFWDKINKKLYLKIGLLILIIIAVLGSAWAFRPNFQASSGRVVSSNNIRYQIWQTSIEMIGKHPILGVGLGNYQNAFTELTTGRANFKEYIAPLALSTHNVFLMFYLTTGLLGFLAFMVLLVFFYRTAFKNLDNPWSKILIAAMTALLLQGLVDTPYFKNDLSLIFWLIFGFVVLLKKDE